MDNYEIIMGLEVHVELSTESKIFCGCTTKFGGEPNTHVCEICSGMPGTLPALNQKVVEYAVRAGLALNCKITPFSKFDRKNYFYPDLPKAFQVSQLYLPICRNGDVEIKVGDQVRHIGIHEIHMEEDAGKLVHDEWEDCTLVDYNRCGVPLIEIVSEPDFRSAEEVVAYLEKLKSTLQYLGVSDCKMQEGSMRADINLSVRKQGETKYGTRTEMKNMASLKAITRAIEGESRRQIDIIEDGGSIRQETRRWDDNKGSSYAMRSKEDAHDYKYFPEPDLMPIEIPESYIENIRKSLPEMPEAKKVRYMEAFSLPEYDADILTKSKYLVEVFEKATEICNNPKDVSNWIMTDLLKMLKDGQMEPEDMSFSPGALGQIIQMVNEGKINRGTGKKIFAEVFAKNVDPVRYVDENGLAQISDAGSIEGPIRDVLIANERPVTEYLAGNDRNLQFLIGQSMRALKGKADPQAVKEILLRLLEEKRNT
jgi:aspartyl-tRNA(Asn)/glutamyl-tRNA(Gln) amidotransferase subunit B